jgi:hypothetical protein
LTFDGTPRSVSTAIGSFWKDGYAGALPFAVGGSDITRPASITTLATTLTSDQTIVLTWLATGDDGLVGTAAVYDLRYSTQPITDDASFAAATAATGLPSPSGAGTLQIYAMMGMTPGTQYYFAIKARDEANNWSPLSNVLVLQTQMADLVAPRPVGDLR